jgi:putative endonuclease
MTNHTNRVIYTGVTNDIIRRVYEHKNHLIEGFTSKYNIDKLVYFDSCDDIKSAIAREKQIKAGSRKKKIDLITKNNPEFLDLYKDIL